MHSNEAYKTAEMVVGHLFRDAHIGDISTAEDEFILRAAYVYQFLTRELPKELPDIEKGLALAGNFSLIIKIEHPPLVLDTDPFFDAVEDVPFQLDKTSIVTFVGRDLAGWGVDDGLQKLLRNQPLEALTVIEHLRESDLQGLTAALMSALKLHPEEDGDELGKTIDFMGERYNLVINRIAHEPTESVLICTGVSISERERKDQETISGLHDRLEMLNHYIDHLKLEAKSRAIIFDVLAHDVGSPMAKGQLYVELVRRERRKPPADQNQANIDLWLERANDALVAGNNIITEAKQINKAMTVREDKVKMEINNFVHSAVRNLSAFAHERGVRILCDLDETLPYVWQIPGLGRSLHNLVSNAIKYSPVGGEVMIRTYTEGNSIVMEVKDEGIGIDLEEQPDIFKENYRGTNNNSGTPGTGVGLAVAKFFVDLNHGTIEVESSPPEPRGSTFRIKVPMPEKVH
ncbi:MAG TPA: sensor histidine kinase [Vitreimonas sp.]|nr:sensor histidine kinase [Vitreimonas sp.]